MEERQACRAEVSTLTQHAHPKLGKVPVGAVDTALVVAVLKPIWRAKPETAKRARGRIEAILDWAKAHGFRTAENPARRGYLVNLLPARSKTVTHHAALPLAQLPKFKMALRQQGAVAARALEFAILTAASEVIGAMWSELSVEDQVCMPGPRMKSGIEHRVPRASAAIELLASDAARTQATGNGICFPRRERRRAFIEHGDACRVETHGSQ